MKKSFFNITITAFIFGFASLVMLSACNDDTKLPGYEFMPDMYRSPSYETNSLNALFKDSSSNRLPVHGTIPRGDTYMPYPYPNTPEAYEAAGKDLKNPLENTAQNLADGKQDFETYCIHCHGEQGKGDGPLVQNGKFPAPPSYSDKLKDLSEGKMFHTITYGKNLMGSHASQLNQKERWKVIMYVQTLQKLSGSAGTTIAATDSTKKKS